ncbi:MAG: hypothetical protein IPJ19_17925 [Planctomycetes bacterium]|nr:hypothetical protein [Planctomycetota bacterium]
MNQLRVLLYKEWRDQRTFCIAALGACLLLSLTALRIDGAALMKRSFFVDSVLPVCCMIFAAVLATESIARDAQSRVADTLARLAAPRTLVWSAKVLFVLLAVVVFILALLPLDYCLTLASSGGVLSGDQVLARPQFWAVTGALATAGLAFACVLRRALPATIVAALTLAVLPFVAGGLPPCRLSDWLYVFLAIWSPVELAGLACASFAVGALLAFSVRHADPLGWRRAVALCTGVSLVLLPSVAGSARRAWAAFDMPFGDPAARVCLAAPSPDARFVAVQMGQDLKADSTWTGTPGQELRRRRQRREVWILDRSCGTWNEIDTRDRELLLCSYRGFVRGPWDARSRLSVRFYSSPFVGAAGGLQLIDPATSTVVLAPPLGISMFDTLEAETGLGAWYTTIGYSRQSKLIVRWKERGIDLELSDRVVFAASPEPGILFIQRENGLVRHEMASGSETLLHTFPFEIRKGQGLRVSPDGRHIAVLGGGITTILDSSDGRLVVELPQGVWLVDWSRVPGRLGLVDTMSSRRELSWFALDEKGVRTLLATDMPNCVALGTDRLLAYDDHRIECMKLDGSERETLYEAKP